MDADLVMPILQNIQERLSSMEGRLGDLDERMGAVERRLGGVEMRLTNVEGLLVETATNTRLLLQIVKDHERRIGTLEPTTP